ncbi:disease resistance protein RPV1-like [Humulus lupulus]|uniref:disease resistance protein RPV1-like n=1 Tax=Humulus lupulus TaxID=3486 RepID=UPI002B408623|nr:disease resistance protein RPV1-like [Humulus lupulus]
MLSQKKLLDKQVLRNIVRGNENIYDLQILNEEEALKLFLLHAFKRENVEEKEIEFSRKFVDYAKGLPIAFKVLGSGLYLKSMNAWQSLLSKLKQVEPNQGVQKVLKVSFDGLEEKEKSVFLDIACFFRGDEKYFVKDILDDCGSFDADVGVLVDKCLITIFKSKSIFGGNKEILQMHDLLQEMGQSIARGSDRNHLQNHSRLWMSKDICHVLKNNMNLNCLPNLSKANLQNLFLNGCTSLVDLPPLRFHNIPDNAEKQSKVMHREYKYNHSMHKYIVEKDSYNEDKNIFTNLLHYKWRKEDYSCLLDLKGCSKLRSLSEMSGNIKFICLRSTAIKELHSSIGYLKNLLVLDLGHCEWIKNLPTSIRNLESLEYLDMIGCKSIKKFPELPRNIKVLHLSGTSIQRVDIPSFECLPCLHILNMNSCKELESLPTSICKLKSLVTLDLGFCSQLKSFPEILEPMEKLEKLNLEETRIEETPSTIENLVVLDELNLNYCKNLKCLPTTICKLKSLTKLYILHCSQFKSFPEILEPMEKLKKLNLDGTGIEEMPSTIENLVVLDELNLRYCKNLKCIPTTICKLKSLTKLYINGCSQFKSFPEILEPMEKLKKLHLSESGIEEMPSTIENLVVLDELHLLRCKNLKCIPTTICKLKSLKKLHILGCSQFKSFPEILEPMDKLKKLNLDGTGIEEMPSTIENLVVLDQLSLCDCKNLKCIPTTLCKLKSLTRLYINGCSQLKSFPEILEPMENLEKLYLDGTRIEVLPPSIERLVTLKHLRLTRCKDLKSIPTNIYNMRNISKIYINDSELKNLSYCGFSSLILSGPSEAIASQLRAEVQNSKCRSSCPITSINVLFRLHSDGLKCGADIPFACCECFLFYSVHNILASQYFEYNIYQCREISKILGDKYLISRVQASFCYSGNAIPRWFTYQSVGSSIEVNLVPSSDNYFSFLGFAICIVVDFDPCTSNPDVVDLNCEYHFRSNDGQSSKFCSIPPTQKATHDSDGDSNVDNNDILDCSSGTVFISYLYRKGIWRFLSKVDKAFFEFYFGESKDSIGKGRIKQCGVRLVYRQDAKEFDRAEPYI